MISSSEVVIMISIFYYDKICYFYLEDFNLVYNFVMGLFSHYNEIAVGDDCNITFAVAANKVITHLTTELLNIIIN
jgi:hypothetical protein